MSYAPFSWQVPVIEQLTRILRRSRAAVDTSDVGVGKTYAALFTACNLGLPVGVICPKSLIPTWQQACQNAGVEPIFIVSYDKAVRGFEYGKWLNSRLYQWSYPTQHLLICDEAHRMRHYKTRTCKMFESGADWGAKFKLLALSATLAESPLHFKALGRWLDIFARGQFWPWAMMNGVVKDGFAYQFTTVPEFRAEALMRLHNSIFPNRGVCLKVEDIPDFPDQVIDFVPVSVDDKALKRVEKEVEELRKKALDDAPVPIVELLRVRQEMELLKVESLVEQAQDVLEEGSSVVVFAEFLATLHALAEGLKEHQPLVIEGETEDREVLRQQFQNNEKRVIILQSRVGGVGLSLHDLHGVPRVALISPSYSATVFRQVLGRIRRAGGKSAAIQRIVYVRGSVEGRVIASVKRKMQSLETLQDGDLSWFQKEK